MLLYYRIFPLIFKKRFQFFHGGFNKCFNFGRREFLRRIKADKRNKSPIFLGAGVLLGAFKPAFEDIRIFLPRA
jgi:hypothetical protein